MLPTRTVREDPSIKVNHQGDQIEITASVYDPMPLTPIVPELSLIHVLSLTDVA